MFSVLIESQFYNTHSKKLLLFFNQIIDIYLQFIYNYFKYTPAKVYRSHTRTNVLLPENWETVSGCGGTHAGGPIFGERGEHLQADDQVHHRDVDRRLRQGTERQGQVLVVLVPRIRHARDRPRSCEMLTAPRVGLVSPRHLEREKASRRRFLRRWRRGQLSSPALVNARRQHVAA